MGKRYTLRATMPQLSEIAQRGGIPAAPAIGAETKHNRKAVLEDGAVPEIR